MDSFDSRSLTICQCPKLSDHCYICIYLMNLFRIFVVIADFKYHKINSDKKILFGSTLLVNRQFLV